MASHFWPNICIYNDPSSGESDSTVQAYTNALAKHVVNDFGPEWSKYCYLYFVSSKQKPPPDMWTLAVLSTSDEAGALGYHDLTPSGLPLGKCFAATDRQFGDSLSVTLCHELDEMLADPLINLAAQADDGKFYALEVCDAVEADAFGYQIDGIQMSNFVCPAWFGHGAGKMDFKGQLSTPFVLAPGGYISVLDPGNGQGWTQVTRKNPELAKHMAADDYAQWRAKAVPKVGSRRERRRRGSSAWTMSTYRTAA